MWKENGEGRSTGKEEKGQLEIKWKIRSKYKGILMTQGKELRGEKKIKSRGVYTYTLSTFF